ncbi:MAG: hypothetical protein RLZZ316_325, partial [Bacteroidota bacterium]
YRLCFNAACYFVGTQHQFFMQQLLRRTLQHLSMNEATSIFLQTILQPIHTPLTLTQ